MRQFLDTDRTHFIEQAMAALKGDLDTPGRVYLVRLLAPDDLALERITDPNEFTETQAVELVRRIMALDPAVDVRLVRLLLTEDRDPLIADPWHASRVLEVVGRVSNGQRLLALLTALARHRDPRVRSKATLLMGRFNQNLRWVEHRLAEQDARIRANAVESVWGVDVADVARVLKTAATDSHHRVVANAAVGLHRTGDLVSIALIEAMFAHQADQFRAAAAWAMGETGDPRFLPALGEGCKDEAGPVRRNALRARIRIRERLARIEQMSPLRVTAEFAGDNLKVEVRSSEGRVLDSLPATAFVVSHEGSPVEISAVQFENCPQWPSYALSLGTGTRDGSLIVNVYTDGGAGRRTVH